MAFTVSMGFLLKGLGESEFGKWYLPHNEKMYIPSDCCSSGGSHVISFRWKLLLKSILLFNYIVHLTLLFTVIIPVLVLIILGRGVIVLCLFNYVNANGNMSFRKTNQKWNWNKSNINYEPYIFFSFMNKYYYIINEYLIMWQNII